MKKESTIIKTKILDRSLSYENNSIIMRNKSGQSIALVEGARPCFNTVITQKGEILIFYKDAKEEGYMARVLPFSKSESRKLLPSDAILKSEKCFLFQSARFGFGFFYALKNEEKEGLDIYVTDFSLGGEVKIDAALQMKNRAFYFFGSKTPVVFYRNAKNILTMCFFSGVTMGEYQSISLSQRGDNILDMSCLVEEGCIHILYIILQGGNTHLMYRQHTSGGLSSVRVLHTHKKLEGCLIFKHNENIFSFTTSKATVFYAFSKDKGVSFYPITVYFKSLNITEKAYFESTLLDGFVAHEVFLEGSTPLLIEEFSNPQVHMEEKFTQEDVSRLKSKIINFEKEIKEKNVQVKEMSNSISQNQQQNIMFLQQWRGRYDELMLEHVALKKQYEELKNECEQLIKDEETTDN